MAKGVQSAERVSHLDASDNYVYQRSLLAYHEAAGLVSGDVLEIGTGSGYGIEVVSPAAKHFVTVDKFDAGIDLSPYPNAEFRLMNVPPLAFPDDSFDCVVTFQVIEHIRKDTELVREIHRVLRPGGRLVISTPNIKMSLTRNPWHVREYTADSFRELLSCCFADIDARGVFGRKNVMEYYGNNRRSVEKIAKYDILRFRQWLPRPLLRIPYDILNRRNRRKLMNDDCGLATGIGMDDYYLAPAGDSAFDLFYTATKG